MSRAISISAARQGFFDLFEAVVKHVGRKVVISSRTNKRRAVLVDETYLQKLEDAEKQLRSLEALGALPAPAARFTMIGSMQLIGNETDPIAEIREEASRQWDTKIRSL